MAPIIQKRDSTLGGAIWIIIVIFIIVFIVGLAFACYKVTPRHNAKVVKPKSPPAAQKHSKEKPKVDNKPGACCAQCPCRSRKPPKQREKAGISPNSNAENFPAPGDPLPRHLPRARVHQPIYDRQGYQPPLVNLRNMHHDNFAHQPYGPSLHPVYGYQPDSVNSFSSNSATDV